MGRKKKPFIDKKKAQRFQLVPRSQHDPLCGDIEETQYVLKLAEVPPVLNREERLQEQHKYGIHFDDDYNYLQHLKEPKMCEMMEPVLQEQDTREQGKKEKLPQELFGSDVIVEGQLNKVLPVSGPQPDWDPDIVAALERVEVTSDPEEEEELEDDFVLMANGGEPGVPVYVTEHTMEDDSVPWWHDFLPLGTATMQIEGSDCSDHNVLEEEKEEEEDEEEEEEEEKEEEGEKEEEEEEEEEVHRKVLSGPPSVQGMITGLEEKPAQFTEYSLSSSVVPRNDALTLLDERFEQFMIQYEDSQIGPLDDEGEIPSTNIANDKWLLEYAIQDFDKHHNDKLDDGYEETSEEEKSEMLVDRHDQSSLLPADANSSGESDDGGNMEVIQVEERGRGWGRREQWDCESILSTYSNLYNHPTKITEPREEGRCIKLSRKTGIPLGTVPGPLPKERHQKRVSTERQPGESTEEKKKRKHAVKEERRHCRREKKTTKLAFKTEQLKQERALASQYHTAAVV